MKKERYIFLEHTADIKFQAFGKTIKEVFKNSALALNELIKGKIRVKNKIKKKFVIENKDNIILLYNFLEEFLYLLDAEDFLMNKIRIVSFREEKIVVEVFGDRASNYKFSNNVKAVTYNEMFIKKEKGKWIAQVVLDV